MAPQVVQYPRATSLTAHSSRAAGIAVTGGVRDSTSSVTFNLIGRIQPDQKGLNPPNQVYTSPQQAFSWMHELRSHSQRSRAAAGPEGNKSRTGVEGTGGAGGHERAWLRCPWAVAGPGRASPSDTSAAGVEGAGGPGGPGCGARGRRRGLAGLRDDAPSEARSADGSRAGRRPRAHKAARPTGQHVRRPEIRRGHKRHQ